MKGFKSFSEFFRDSSHEWLLVHKRGEYEYRNPDSVFIHRWESFPTHEAALEYLDQRIAPADRREWTLFHSESCAKCAAITKRRNERANENADRFVAIVNEDNPEHPF